MDSKASGKSRCACDGCKKKIGIVEKITNVCSCGLTFCSTHKPADMHKCKFDYHARTSTILSTTLTKVVASKVESF